MIGVPVLVRHHAHHFLALHLGAERAADPAVGAGGDEAVLGLTLRDQRIFRQGGGRAGLYAGSAGDALGVHEGHVLTGRNGRIKTARLNGERQGSLLLVAGAHAARADDAFARIEGEVGVAGILRSIQMIGTRIAVAHLAQAHHARHVLQLAVSVRRAGQAIQRVIRDVQLHHSATDVGQLLVLRADLHSFGHRGGAGGGQALHAIDLHQAHPARTEGLELLGGAELRDRDFRKRRGAHDRGSLRHRHFAPIDGQRDELGAVALRCAVIVLDNR